MPDPSRLADAAGQRAGEERPFSISYWEFLRYPDPPQTPTILCVVMPSSTPESRPCQEKAGLVSEPRPLCCLGALLVAEVLNSAFTSQQARAACNEPGAAAAKEGRRTASEKGTAHTKRFVGLCQTCSWVQ